MTPIQTASSDKYPRHLSYEEWASTSNYVRQRLRQHQQLSPRTMMRSDDSHVIGTEDSLLNRKRKLRDDSLQSDSSLPSEDRSNSLAPEVDIRVDDSDLVVPFEDDGAWKNSFATGAYDDPLISQVETEHSLRTPLVQDFPPRMIPATQSDAKSRNLDHSLSCHITTDDRYQELDMTQVLDCTQTIEAEHEACGDWTSPFVTLLLAGPLLWLLYQTGISMIERSRAAEITTERWAQATSDVVGDARIVDLLAQYWNQLNFATERAFADLLHRITDLW